MVKPVNKDSFDVRLGTIRAPNGARRVEGFFKRVGYHARKSGKKSSGAARYNQGYYQSASRSAWSRRVMVKVSIVKLAGKGRAAQRAHLKYIERGGVGEQGERGHLYGSGDLISSQDLDTDMDLDQDLDQNSEALETDKEIITPADFLARSQHDRHQFRLIISPEDSDRMIDLKSFSRDLARQMEKELGTKLDWVAVNHYDTAQPHIHMVIRGKRDDGKDLVMPKSYITHGIRSQAQELVTMELGPVTEIERQQRLWDGIHKDRLTLIDRNIIRDSQNLEIDLTREKIRRSSNRHLMRARLNRLTEMGLAEPLGKGRWKIDGELGPVLKRMGERTDIVKRLNRSLKKDDLSRLVDSRSIYDPADGRARTITGRLIDKGTHGDLHNKGYVVIDCLDGRARHVDIGAHKKLAGLKQGMIISVEPHVYAPRVSDRTIEEVAKTNQGRYGYNAHQKIEPGVSIKFVEAHFRRLGTLQKSGIVDRSPNGEFEIPENYLERCADHEFEKAKRLGPNVTINSRLSLQQQKMTRGRTWLDYQLRDQAEPKTPNGFGKDVQQAKQVRRHFLLEQGVTQSLDSAITDQHLDKLEAIDINDAAKDIARGNDLTFNNQFEYGRVSGKLVGTVDRPSGKYAILERAHEFSLVPWQNDLEKARGRDISGSMSASGIRWELGRNRDLGIGM